MENKDEILRIIKKYAYVCGQEENKHLAFRHISAKKHKEDFEGTKCVCYKPDKTDIFIQN